MIVMMAAEAVAAPGLCAAGAAPARSRRASRAWAWTLASAVPLLLAVDVTMHLHSGSTYVTSWWLGDAGVAATLLVPGALVALKRPGNSIGWLLLVASFATAVSAAGREYLIFGLLGGSPAPAYLWIGWFTDSLYVFSMGTLPLTLMLFPDGHAMSRRVRPLLGLPVLFIVLGSLGQLSSSYDITVRGHLLRSPAENLVPGGFADAAANLAWPVFMLSILTAIVLIVLRYRHSTGETRQQMKWVAWAGAIGGLELLSEMLPANTIAPVTGPIASAVLTGSVCIAILRHRMFDIDLVINRTLAFGVLSTLVVGGYLGVVIALSSVLGEPVRVGPGLVAAVAVAVAFAPARSRVQRSVDRLMFGERTNPYRVMTQLGQRLESSQQSGELAVVVNTITQTLKLPYAAIFDPAGGPLASTGTAAGSVVEHALTYQGTAVGCLLVSHRAGSNSFSTQEARLLSDLARQVGAAVHAVRLSGELRASRQRLVSAKEEERRRLRRDLHDGLGPKLAAVGLKLDATKIMVDTRPGDAKNLLTDVRDDVRGTIEDIRRLVYELRPPALDELGLVGALRECVGRFDTGSDAVPEFDVRAPEELPPLPAAVEVATYRIVNEAVTNVVRHAGARHCEVSIELDEMLHLAIRDDGVGRCQARRAGVGTASMAERAAELGGSLEVSPGELGRGTLVLVAIPVATAERGRS